MSGHIPKSFIDDILARCDIVELIDARVPLKKAGRNLVACCPFHNEKTPSFTVSPEKQFYHCFGCSAHGTALGFLMEYDRLSFPEAVEALAAAQGVEMPKDSGYTSNRSEHDALYNLLQSSANFYKQQLKNHEQAITYLKNRGISGKIAADYWIGFAPQSWDNILKNIGETTSDVKNLSRLGMIVENNKGGHYDRFRNRIMFPIRDSRGRVIAFGGRVIDAQDNPKYMNSPESVVFHKGHELYGIYELRKYNQKLDHILVVEGYMDVVALAQHDIRNTVATLGTASSAEHLVKLLRLCKKVIFCFDGDAAGKQAAWRALENSLPIIRSGHEVLFMFLPENEDPDSIVNKEGKTAFSNRCKQAVSLSNFFFEHLKTQADPATLEGKAKLNQLSQPLIKKINDHLFQQLLIKQLSEAIGLSEDKIWANDSSPLPFKPQAQPNRIKLEMNDIRIAVAALLTDPKLSLKYSAEVDQLQALNYPGVPLLLELVETITSTPDITTAGLLQRFSGTQHEPALIKLASYEFVLDNQIGNTIEEIFHHAIRQLHEKSKQQRYQQLIRKPLHQLSEDEKNELKSLGKN